MTVKTRSFFKVLSLLFVALLLVSTVPHFSMTIKAAENSDRIIVSMGDSYSSGEGLEPYYGSEITPIEKKVKDQRWLSHRSTKSWPGQLSLDSVGKMSDGSNINNHWYFVAMSGAITKNILDESIAAEEDKKDETKKYKFKEYQKDVGIGKGKKDAVKGKEPIDCQLKVFDDIKEKGQAVDYVTLTIGGNDAGFVDILKTAATTASYLGPNETYDKLKGIIDSDLPEIKTNLKNCYQTIYERSQASVIVAGYPELLGSFGAASSPIKYGSLVTLIGGTALTPYEASMINNAVDIFNNAIDAVIDECDDSIPVYYVSVKDAFRNKGAYSTDSYINGLQLNPKHIFSQEELDDWELVGGASFHPNEKGAAAYAKCVQDKIDYLERTPRPKPTEKPTDKTVEIPTHKPTEAPKPTYTAVQLASKSLDEIIEIMGGKYTSEHIQLSNAFSSSGAPYIYNDSVLPGFAFATQDDDYYGISIMGGAKLNDKISSDMTYNQIADIIGDNDGFRAGQGTNIAFGITIDRYDVTFCFIENEYIRKNCTDATVPSQILRAGNPSLQSIGLRKDLVNTSEKKAKGNDINNSIILKDLLGSSESALIELFGDDCYSVQIPESGLKKCITYNALSNVAFGFSQTVDEVMLIYVVDCDKAVRLTEDITSDMTRNQLLELNQKFSIDEFHNDVYPGYYVNVKDNNGLIISCGWNDSDYLDKAPDNIGMQFIPNN